MTFGWPQIAYLALMFLSTGIALAKHGEPRTGNHSIFVALGADVITLGLLWWGGFFG